MVKAYIPKTLEEALKILNDDTCRIVAGGTDMLIQHHNRQTLPIAFKENVIYIANLEELQTIEEDKDYTYYGATAPLEAILEHDVTPKILKDTIIEMASPAIRHTGTLAGNIGNASPAGDSLVPLYLLNALVEIQSINETKRMLLSEFITGVRRIALKQNELITKIIVPKINFDKAVFTKVGPRLSDAISKLSFAAAYSIVDGLVLDFRFSFGAVNQTVVRKPEIECQYITMPVEEVKAKVDEIVEQYAPFIRPIDDQRSNKTYRKQVSLNLLRDFILNM